MEKCRKGKAKATEEAEEHNIAIAKRRSKRKAEKKFEFDSSRRNGRFICLESNCNRSFETKTGLGLHLLWHKRQQNGQYVCPEPKCIRVFETNLGLDVHLRWHKKQDQKEKPKQKKPPSLRSTTSHWPCPHCKAGPYLHKSSLNRHIKNKHQSSSTPQQHYNGPRSSN